MLILLNIEQKRGVYLFIRQIYRLLNDSFIKKIFVIVGQNWTEEESKKLLQETFFILQTDPLGSLQVLTKLGYSFCKH
jgi:hypothetical protein